ncbi:GAF domain-containing protein [Melioribacteraceae bacterium 4301-Me]|uniref:sensor domain-containing diguanylate cyclase n=1 Tax=Pyranulibacter aquaticus TaxID=3163344 RepID=UPI00359B2684
MTDKYKKRLLIFIFIPVLIAIPFLTDDLMLRIISSVILVIYVAFIIFLRDSVKAETTIPIESTSSISKPPKDSTTHATDYETDEGEEFQIISPNKTVEILTQDNFSRTATSNKKDVFKPQNFKEHFDKIVHEEFPHDVNQDEQFGFVLEKILNVVKDAFMAHSAVFFWYNKVKKRLTLERFVSSSSHIARKKFDLEDDILGKIIQKEEPELLTDISPTAEIDVIRYYTAPQGIKSFVGVPLFYGKSLAGILALDSKVNDAFGIESVFSLGRVVRIISIIISMFEEKFSETLAEQRLKALLSVLSYDKKFETESELFTTLESSVSGLIPWDAFTFVYYYADEQKFKTTKIVNRTSLKYIGENLEIDLGRTLVGKAILSGIPVKIDDTSNSDYPRFSQTEEVSFDGSFLAIPMVYDDKNYGVLCFESLKKNAYSNEDVNFVKNSMKMFAFILYSYSTINLLKNLLSVDIETKALNYDSFVERLTVDLVKASELKIPGAVALISIDEFLEQDSLFEGNPFPKVLKAISQMIKDEMTPLNIFGRLKERVFGVYFFNSSPKDVFVWAEKLRIKIARKPIAVVSKQTTFTVSIGISSTSGKTDVHQILYDAELALKKAQEKGGNSVKITN